MTHDVVMPQLGLTMDEGSVVSWQKQFGDWVKKGEILFTVETDKVQMEVESTASGYLNLILAEVGMKVPVGTVIAILGDQPGDGASHHLATAADDLAATRDTMTGGLKLPGEDLVEGRLGIAGASVAPEKLSPREFACSPRARRIAHELGIDITAVKPGRGRRVTEEDVRYFWESKKE